MVLFLAIGGLFAADTGQKKFTERADTEFHRAQRQFQSNTNSVTAAWEFSRACFDSASLASSKTARAAFAQQGITVCRQSPARDTHSAPAHYYCGMNIGQLARTKTLGALKLVREMESEFKAAEQLDERFDYAGPERNLGLLYRDAPGWPLSVGSRRKAREFLERAATLAPDYPENYLNLVESFLQWHEHDAANRELQALDALWPRAQTNFIGEAWEQGWDDWSTRRDAARKKLNEVSPPADSPKSSR
jgi:tetratricopeptide (TPR) repeat protein